MEILACVMVACNYPVVLILITMTCVIACPPSVNIFYVRKSFLPLKTLHYGRYICEGEVNRQIFKIKF